MGFPHYNATRELVCYGGHEWFVTYDVLMNPQLPVIRLDKVSGVSDVICNVDDTALVLEFASSSDRDNFKKQVQAAKTVLTAKPNTCPGNSKPLLRRIISQEDLDRSGKAYLHLSTSATKYDEIFANASISFGKTGNKCVPKNPEDSDHVCIGVNINKDCTGSNVI